MREETPVGPVLAWVSEISVPLMLRWGDVLSSLIERWLSSTLLAGKTTW